MDLVKKADANVIVPSSFGAGDDITVDDFQIGRIQVMQAMSEFVAHDKFRPGDIINMQTEEKIGDKKVPAEFIILKSFKYWVEMDGEKFVRKIPALNSNELPWTEGTIKRTFVHSFYVLLPDEMKTGMAIPYELSFKSTDIKNAQKLSMLIYKLRQANIASWGKVFSIITYLETKGSNSWYLKSPVCGRDATDEEQIIAMQWFGIISNVKTTLQTSAEELKEAEGMPF